MILALLLGSFIFFYYAVLQNLTLFLEIAFLN